MSIHQMDHEVQGTMTSKASIKFTCFTCSFMKKTHKDYCTYGFTRCLTFLSHDFWQNMKNLL